MRLSLATFIALLPSILATALPQPSLTLPLGVPTVSAASPSSSSVWIVMLDSSPSCTTDKIFSQLHLSEDKVLYVYKNVGRGFAAVLSPAQRLALEGNACVLTVIKDSAATLDGGRAEGTTGKGITGTVSVD